MSRKRILDDGDVIAEQTLQCSLWRKPVYKCIT